MLDSLRGFACISNTVYTTMRHSRFYSVIYCMLFSSSSFGIFFFQTLAPPRRLLTFFSLYRNSVVRYSRQVRGESFLRQVRFFYRNKKFGLSRTTRILIVFLYILNVLWLKLVLYERSNQSFHQFIVPTTLTITLLFVST